MPRMKSVIPNLELIGHHLCYPASCQHKGHRSSITTCKCYIHFSTQDPKPDISIHAPSSQPEHASLETPQPQHARDAFSNPIAIPIPEPPLLATSCPELSPLYTMQAPYITTPHLATSQPPLERLRTPHIPQVSSHGPRFDDINPRSDEERVTKKQYPVRCDSSVCSLDNGRDGVSGLVKG